LVLKTKLTSDQIERDPDGTVVIVDGYQRTPVAEWAKTIAGMDAKAATSARQWCARRPSQ
jgi:hypothetical protein